MRSRRALEPIVVGLVIVTLPLIARTMASGVERIGTTLGLARVTDALLGRGGFTDIGGGVTFGYGLIARDRTPYDTFVALDVIGQGAYGDGSHTHPPPSAVLWLPLLAFDYGWWLSFWVVASAAAIAVSMRLLDVPVLVAYPVAAGVCLTGPGAESLVTTYPVTAMAIAAAWRFRDRPWPGGLALTFLVAERGLSALLLLDPLRRGRWRVVGVALGGLLVLSVVAVLLEPDVFVRFLTDGRAAIEYHVARVDLYTPYAILERRGLPGWLVVVPAVILSALAWRLGREPFWILFWVTTFVTPLAWYYSSIQLLPLAVVVWRASAAGRAVTIVAGFLVFAVFPLVPLLGNLGWTVAVVLLGVGLLIAPVDRADARVR